VTTVAVISHHCVGCGGDLSRVRARLDAALGLPIVQCGCGRAAVRHGSRRHTARGRSLRFIRSILHLAFRAFVITIATLAMVGAATVTSANLAQRELGQGVVGSDFLITPGVIICLATLSGLAFGGVLSHRSPAIGIIAMMTLPVILLVFPAVMELADGGDPRVALRALRGGMLVAAVMPLAWMIGAVGVVVAISVVAPQAERSRRHRWRRRLARMRAEAIR